MTRAPFRAVAVLAVLFVVAACGAEEPQRRGAERMGDDGRIAFASSRDGDFEIYTMTPDGSDVAQLTRNEESDATEARDDSPAWSPGGTMMAFTSSRDHPVGGIEGEEIYVMNADGSDQRRLTEDDAWWTFGPWWTEDGVLAFTRCRGGFRDCAIEAIAPDGTGRRTIMELPQDVGGIAPSPDGSKVLFAPVPFTDEGPPSESDVYVMNADGRERRRLTSARGLDGGAVWSPDGSRIAFLSDRDRNGRCLWHDCVGYNPELYVMNADGSDQRRLTDDPGQEGSAVWSPDGTRILFTGYRDGDDFELYVVNDDGTCLTQLTDNGEWDWSPDWLGEAGTGAGRIAC
jgi:Tol biopolymer transport system component